MTSHDAPSGTGMCKEIRMLRTACGEVRRFTLSAAIRKSAPGDGFCERRNLTWDHAELSATRPCARNRT
jgi:hypothetical protein